MTAFGISQVLDHVLGKDEVERAVGKRESLASVEVDDLIEAPEVGDISVEPAYVRVATGA
jgi:hypothetical protein